MGPICKRGKDWNIHINQTYSDYLISILFHASKYWTLGSLFFSSLTNKYLRKYDFSSVDLLRLIKCLFRMKIEFERSLSLELLLFFREINFSLMCSLIGILHIFDRFEERSYDSGLLVRIEVSWLCFDLSVCLSIPLWNLLWRIFLLVLIRRNIELFEAWGRNKHLLFAKAFFEVFILNQE